MTTEVATLGGGHGQGAALRGLKEVEDVQIKAITTGADEGGSTKKISEDYGLAGFAGDVSECIAALAPDDFGEFLRHRHKGGFLDGHSEKNIQLLTAVKKFGLEEGLKFLGRYNGIDPHEVGPVSFEPTTLKANLKYGVGLSREVDIDTIAGSPLWIAGIHAILDIYFSPKIDARLWATMAVRTAKFVIICPGDLYTSVLPVLLALGMKEALRETRAKLIVMLNLRTKKGETNGYTAEDFIREIEKYSGRRADIIIYHEDPQPSRDTVILPTKSATGDRVRIATPELAADRRVIRAVLENEEGVHDPVAVENVFRKIFFPGRGNRLATVPRQISAKR